jgi:hypothetical protein
MTDLKLDQPETAEVEVDEKAVLSLWTKRRS